jgi:hypothetical protein
MVSCIELKMEVLVLFTQLQIDDVIESLTNLILENDLKTECLCVQGWAGSIDIKCTWHAQLTLQTLQIIG